MPTSFPLFPDPDKSPARLIGWLPEFLGEKINAPSEILIYRVFYMGQRGSKNTTVNNRQIDIFPELSPLDY